MTDAPEPLAPAIFIALTKHYALGYHGYDIDSPEFAASKAAVADAIRAAVASAEARGRREALEEVKALVNKAARTTTGDPLPYVKIEVELDRLLSGTGEERSPR